MERGTYDRAERSNINITNSNKPKVGSLDAFQGISSKRHAHNICNNKFYIFVLIVNVNVYVHNV